VNGREQLVYSGSKPLIDDLEAQFFRNGVPAIRLASERAFHSALMEKIKEEFLGIVSNFKFQKPRKRFLSNVTGKWADEEVTHPEYWWQQMRRTVQFATGIREVAKEFEWVWLEIGPSDVLSKLVRS